MGAFLSPLDIVMGNLVAGGFSFQFLLLAMIPWLAAYQGVKRKTQMMAGFATISMVHLVPGVLFVVAYSCAVNMRGIGSGGMNVFIGFRVTFSAVWAVVLRRRYRKKLIGNLRRMVTEGG
ncbi:hypothetical protein N9B94_02105 [Verrucomicrobia bacterium]|nr:hypothetical protein [Verrucomicrobiota bacterium]